MNDTPRTDAAIYASKKHPYRESRERELHDFSRQLERELSLSKACCKRLEEFETKLSAVMPSDFKDWHQNSKAEWPEVAAWVISSQRERLKELEDWKEEALAVEAQWNPNALATMLGAKIGQSQRQVIAAEVPKLLEQVKLMREAGDELAEYISPSAIGFTPSVIENWQKYS